MYTTPIQFLAIGELLADIISENYVNDVSEAKSFRLHAGGSPANVCGTLKWMGIQTALVSCVGEDNLGNYLINALKKIGLSSDHITRSKTYPTSIVMIGKSKGTPDFIAYRGADAQLDRIDNMLLQQSSIIHTSAFALSKNPAQHHILEAMSWANTKEKTISVDWNYAPEMWDSGGPMVFQQICSMHPLLKISLDDISRFKGKTLSADDAKNYLDALPARVICLTCGKEGVWYKSSTDLSWHFEPAIKITEVTDTTGAGDAFWSGFIAGYLRGKPLQQCVAEGVHWAGKKIKTSGPLFSLPK
jgi:sugar/nucleoside kinase (ribokinase family)